MLPGPLALLDERELIVKIISSIETGLKKKEFGMGFFRY